MDDMIKITTKYYSKNNITLKKDDLVAFIFYLVWYMCSFDL